MPGPGRFADGSPPYSERSARDGLRCGFGRSPGWTPRSRQPCLDGPRPPAAAVPRLTGLADPLDVAAARLDDAVEVPERGPGGPRVPVHV